MSDDAPGVCVANPIAHYTSVRTAPFDICLVHTYDEIPRRWTFVSNEHGKPMLCDAVAFSLSHSGDQIVIAISLTEVGADIEQIRSDVLNRHWTSEVLSAPEVAWLDSQGRCGARSVLSALDVEGSVRQSRGPGPVASVCRGSRGTARHRLGIADCLERSAVDRPRASRRSRLLLSGRQR
jgi:hypothetical protein